MASLFPPGDFCPLLVTGLPAGDTAVNPGCLLLFRGGGGGGTFLVEMLVSLFWVLLPPVSSNADEESGNFERLDWVWFELLDCE